MRSRDARSPPCWRLRTAPTAPIRPRTSPAATSSSSGARRPISERPALARLRGTSSRSSVNAPAHIGNSAIYATFYTGTPPQQHGFYGGWAWEPKRMRVLPVRTERVRPFWGPLDGSELTVGVLDVPLAPH